MCLSSKVTKLLVLVLDSLLLGPLLRWYSALCLAVRSGAWTVALGLGLVTPVGCLQHRWQATVVRGSDVRSRLKSRQFGIVPLSVQPPRGRANDLDSNGALRINKK